MAEKTARVALRVRPEVRDALVRAAKKDGRSFSALAERILAEWLRANGWLKVPGHDEQNIQR